MLLHYPATLWRLGRPDFEVPPEPVRASSVRHPDPTPPCLDRPVGVELTPAAVKPGGGRRGNTGSSILVVVAVMALLTSACSTRSDHADQTTPSTLAPGSPWLGVFTDVALPVPVNSVT